MNDQLLIADSGSTKTSWMYVAQDGSRQTLETPGINPIRDNHEHIAQVVASLPWNQVSQVRFYGAGCIPPYSDHVDRALAQRYPSAHICVESDLLAAAQALCGNNEGIACILGTGSNSCLYDGLQITAHVSPLGYILGDEGSGAVLGRNLIGDLLKGQLPAPLLQAFTNETGLTTPVIIEKVYRSPLPNQFLASLVPFLQHHREQAEVHDFLVANFQRFFRRNVVLYNRADLPVHFVGGVAHSFQAELAEAALLEGFSLGTVLQKPIEALAAYLSGEQLPPISPA